MKLIITITETPDGNVECKCEGEGLATPLESFFATAISRGMSAATKLAAGKLKTGVTTTADDVRIIPTGRG